MDLFSILPLRTRKLVSLLQFSSLFLPFMFHRWPEAGEHPITWSQKSGAHFQTQPLRGYVICLSLRVLI